MAPGTRRAGARHPTWFLMAILLVDILPAGASLAESDQSGVAMVNSQSYEVFDGAAAVKVVPENDSDLNLTFRSRMQDALRQSSRAVSDDGSLELLFDSSVVQGQFSTTKPSLGRLKAGTDTGLGNRSTDTGVDVEVNVWSSSQDSVLGGRKASDDKRVVNQFLITASLRDRRSGKRLWDGEVRSPMGQSDPERLGQAMIGPLIESLGRTVQNEIFQVR